MKAWIVKAPIILTIQSILVLLLHIIWPHTFGGISSYVFFIVLSYVALFYLSFEACLAITETNKSTVGLIRHEQFLFKKAAFKFYLILTALFYILYYNVIGFDF